MKTFIKRLVVVAVFMVIALLVINYAPEYSLEYNYKDGDLRVIFNSTEITRDVRKLPEEAAILNDEILLSKDTIDILFDKYLQYDLKDKVVISTTEDSVVTFKVGEKNIDINGENYYFKVPATEVTYDYKKDDRYTNSSKASRNLVYIPIKPLEDIYGIDVEFKDKVIITTRNKNRTRFFVPNDEILELKAIEDLASKTMFTLNAGEYVDVFDYDDSKTFNMARTSDGELGYALTNKIKKFRMQEMTTEVNEKENRSKINLAWDYFTEYVTSMSDKSSRRKISEIDVVAPTLIYLKGTEGDITYRSALVKEYMKWANNEGYKVWITVKNDGFSASDTSKLLNDYMARKKLVNNLLFVAKEYKVDGINVDFEDIFKADSEVLSQFVRELSAYCHRADLMVSVCTNVPDGSDNWSLCYEHYALSEAADYITLMTYDQYGSSSSSAGPNASYEWVETNIKKLVERDGVESDKILLGIPFYSRLWKISGGKIVPNVLFMDKAKSYINNSNTSWNEEAKQYVYSKSDGTESLWIEDKTSIAEKLKLINQYNLGGSAAWRLGFETADVWEAFEN